MKIDILTLFPNMFDGVFQESIIKRAVDEKKVEINLINFRDYTNDPHNKVDDTPYGGGAGMVLMCDPIFRCLDEIRDDDSYVVLLSPEGNRYNQEKARKYKNNHKDLVIIAGACQSDYEGLIKVQATFASSPKIINIHALDPAIIAASIALTDKTEVIDIEKAREAFYKMFKEF